MPRTITFNWIDWITLAIVLISVLRGARFGAVAGVIDLAGLIATYLAAAATYPRGAALLHQAPMLSPSWEALIAFVVIWLGLYIPLGLLIRWACAWARFPASGLVGGAFGVARGKGRLRVSLRAPSCLATQPLARRDGGDSELPHEMLRIPTDKRAQRRRVLLHD